MDKRLHEMASVAEYPSAMRANFALFVLVLAYILSFIDRNIMSLLVGPIKAEFEISDTVFSLLHGMAFTLFYVVLGLPIAWLADRFSRKWIITGGIFLWSLMTVACGLAKNFTTLFITRVGVGVGEAALSPPAYSMMSDYFRPERLRWATAIFTMGITVGSGTSYMIGGWAYEYFQTIGVIEVASLGLSIKPWQMTFIAVGLPGLLVVLMMLWVAEPMRRQAMAHSQANQQLTVDSETADGREDSGSRSRDGNEGLPIAAVWAHFKSQWQAYTALIIAMSMMAVIGYGYLIWSPEFLLRTYDVDKATGGHYLGLIFIFAGTAGTFSGAAFADKLQARGFADANMRLIGIVASLLIVPAIIMPLLPDWRWSLGLYTVITFFQYTHFGVGVAALQLITPNQMRAQISAVMLFCTNLMGLGLGGTFVALFTDFAFARDDALNYALAVVGGLAYPLAAVAIFWGLAHYRRAQEAMPEA